MSGEASSERGHVIMLEGDLDHASAPFLTTAVEAVLPHADAIVLDLDRLSFIDSSGFVAILACESKCERHGIGFALAEGSPRVRRLFEIAGVAPMLSRLAEAPGGSVPLASTRSAA
jgi:anti-sigma B factor antagonist